MGTEGIVDVYIDTLVLDDTDPHRFVTKSYTLCQLSMFADGKNVNVGRKGAIHFPLTRSGLITILNVDLADLWFQATAATGTVYVIGTPKE